MLPPVRHEAPHGIGPRAGTHQVGRAQAQRVPVEVAVGIVEARVDVLPLRIDLRGGLELLAQHIPNWRSANPAGA